MEREGEVEAHGETTGTVRTGETRVGDPTHDVLGGDLAHWLVDTGAFCVLCYMRGVARIKKSKTTQAQRRGEREADGGWQDLPCSS